jgi:putative DNA primase/helicase
MGTFLEIATPLIQLGIPVIPVQPNEKRCLLPEWQMKATTDIEQVKLWQTENPHYNVGCVGKPDGFVMLDCDVVGLREQIEKETGQKFPLTLVVRSAGKGAEHIYFRQTDKSRGLGNRSSAGQFDLQSVDKYVVGAGSTLANGKTYDIVHDSPIAEFPDWLADWVERHSDIIKEHGGKGAAVHEDFDFDRFCDHFEFAFIGENDGKYFFEVCPFKGDHHTDGRGKPDYMACAILYDGETIGFSDFATSCEGHGKTIGDLIRLRHQQGYEKYNGKIFADEDTEELIQIFGAEEDEVCEEFGCNCSKRHPLREEIEQVIKEDEERKEAAADVETLKVVEPAKAESDEIVLASGKTDKGVTMSIGGVLASDVVTVELQWLWDQRIPAGKATLFTGKSDNGKSMCLLDVIARVTTGSDFPDGSKNVYGPRKVLLAASEDDPADTIVPRLMAAGAKLENVVLVTVSTQRQGAPKSNRMLKLKEDAKLLEAALKKHPDIALVALDPLSSFFGGESLNKDETVRPIMDALTNALRKTGATMIGIVHTNKRSDVDALEKVLGAGSLVQSSRSVWGFSRDPEVENEFYMALLKSNVSKKRGGMKYKISERKVRLTNGKEVFAPCAEWLGEHESSANDLLDKERQLRKEGGKDGLSANAGQKELARKFLLDNLRRGSNKIGELLDLAMEGGISKATFWRAARELNLESTTIKPKRFLLPNESKPESPMQDVEEL